MYIQYKSSLFDCLRLLPSLTIFILRQTAIIQCLIFNKYNNKKIYHIFIIHYISLPFLKNFLIPDFSLFLEL